MIIVKPNMDTFCVNLVFQLGLFKKKIMQINVLVLISLSVHQFKKVNCDFLSHISDFCFLRIAS